MYIGERSRPLRMIPSGPLVRLRDQQRELPRMLGSVEKRKEPWERIIGMLLLHDREIDGLAVRRGGVPVLSLPRKIEFPEAGGQGDRKADRPPTGIVSRALRGSLPFGRCRR